MSTDYPDTYTMKKMRIIRLQEARGRCEVCGKAAEVIHHKDEDKSNHNSENLAVLCRSCHGVVHTQQPKKTSLFRRMYGVSLQDISDKYKRSKSYFYELHRKKELVDFLAFKEFQEKELTSDL